MDRDGDDGSDDPSNFEIQKSLSRSSSSFEEEQQQSYSELERLAAAMAAEEDTLRMADDWLDDSQVLPDPSAEFDLPQESQNLDGEEHDSDVEVVATEKAVHNTEPASTPQSVERQQLSLLLEAVKLKVQQQNEGACGKEPSGSLIIA